LEERQLNATFALMARFREIQTPPLLPLAGSRVGISSTMQTAFRQRVSSA
jgi:hypothetical protein